MGHEGWVVPDFLTVEPGDARLPWYEGAAAMVFEGDWMEGVIRADEQDIANFDFYLAPTGHEPMRYSAFADIIMIAATTEYPEQAAELLNWWISPETQKKYLLETGGASATLGALPNPDELPRSTSGGKSSRTVAQPIPDRHGLRKGVGGRLLRGPGRRRRRSVPAGRSREVDAGTHRRWKAANAG